jgi:hypothetical protein
VSKFFSLIIGGHGSSLHDLTFGWHSLIILLHTTSKQNPSMLNQWWCIIGSWMNLGRSGTQMKWNWKMRFTLPYSHWKRGSHITNLSSLLFQIASIWHPVFHAKVLKDSSFKCSNPGSVQIWRPGIWEKHWGWRCWSRLQVQVCNSCSVSSL